jgi:hypothetical protein
MDFWRSEAFSAAAVASVAAATKRADRAWEWGRRLAGRHHNGEEAASVDLSFLTAIECVGIWQTEIRGRHYF